jgi:hypothetical protein
MRFLMDDGQEAEIAPGDFVTIAPGHDAWTVGSEPCVLLDLAGFAGHASPSREAGRQPGHGTHAH